MPDKAEVFLDQCLVWVALGAVDGENQSSLCCNRNRSSCDLLHSGTSLSDTSWPQCVGGWPHEQVNARRGLNSCSTHCRKYIGHWQWREKAPLVPSYLDILSMCVAMMSQLRTQSYVWQSSVLSISRGTTELLPNYTWKYHAAHCPPPLWLLFSFWALSLRCDSHTARVTCECSPIFGAAVFPFVFLFIQELCFYGRRRRSSW